MSVTRAVAARRLAAAFVTMLGPGTLYAYGFVARPLFEQRGVPVNASGVPLEIALCFVGLGAMAAGALLPRLGPAAIATFGTALWIVGQLSTGFGDPHLALGWFVGWYGVVGGFGAGCVYVAASTVAARALPARPGLGGGVAVLAFSLGGPLLGSLLAVLPLAAFVTATGCSPVTASIVAGGAVFGAAGLVASRLLGGAEPPGSGYAAPLRQRHAIALWLMLFVNTLAGVTIVATGPPLLREVLGVSPASAFAVLGTLWLCNAGGRALVGSLSDAVDPRRLFVAMFALQAAALLALALVGGPAIALAAIAAVLLCFGGGLGMMPGLCRRYGGDERLPALLGFVLSAWGVAGAVGPWATDLARDYVGTYAEELLPLAMVLIAAVLIPATLPEAAPTGRTLAAPSAPPAPAN